MESLAPFKKVGYKMYVCWYKFRRITVHRLVVPLMKFTFKDLELTEF
jgi:hypothetical protein